LFVDVSKDRTWEREVIGHCAIKKAPVSSVEGGRGSGKKSTGVSVEGGRGSGKSSLGEHAHRAKKSSGVGEKRTHSNFKCNYVPGMVLSQATL